MPWECEGIDHAFEGANPVCNCGRAKLEDTPLKIDREEYEARERRLERRARDQERRAARARKAEERSW